MKTDNRPDPDDQPEKSIGSVVRYVTKADALSAIKGRELDSPRAAGVDWPANYRGHIDCPYPSHGGKGDWRFDQKTGMCHCTCNARHDVFEALTLLRGENPKTMGTFDASKIQAVELLGRQDLIKEKSFTAVATKSAAPAMWHNRFQACKLLNPPAHLRNDGLYLDYMSARLGVSRDDVPMPTTPYAGISSLEYFDQNSADDDKRKPLVMLPCVVLGMVNASGDLTGAICIYLDPTGRQKATLGLDARGKERSVKPFSPGSAKGGEVRFGNAQTATVKIAAEGVETGAALAYAARKAADERVLVACGGTAGFMEVLDRQPRIMRLIAACDRDEAQKSADRPASRRGEKAGVALLMRHQEEVSTSLVLPGVAGESVDWLDILRRDGADAVWNSVINSPVFEPSPEEAPKVEEMDEEESSGPRMLRLGSDVEIAREALAELEARYGTVVYAEGCFWHYDRTHWTPFDEAALRLHVHRFDGSIYTTAKGVSAIKLSKRQIDSVLNEMIPIAGRDGKSAIFADTVPGINCRNGFIVFDEDGNPNIIPHSPEHHCRHVIAAEWSPNGVDEMRMKGSLLSKLLGGSFKNDEDASGKIKVIAEIMGAAALGMATRIQSPKAVVMLGLTAENGKSQVLDIIRGLLPETAVSSIPAGKMGDEKHLIQLAGKLLNMSDELSSAESIAGDTFKKIVTGNHVEARDVFKSAINFKPKAQHVSATNSLPSFKGGIDRGVRRRLLVIEFTRTIPPSERIAEIGQRISTEEIDLLLDFAVQGASRLLRQRKFSDLRSSDEAVRKWVLHTDPVEAWLEECVTCIAGTDPPRVSTKYCYDHFREWCGRSGYTLIPPINKFSERVEAAGKGIGKVRDAKGRYFTGLALSDEGQSLKSFGNPF